MLAGCEAGLGVPTHDLDTAEFAPGGEYPLCRPNFNILVVNKQVRDEALKAAWQGTWKRLVSTHSLQDILITSAVPGWSDWLNKIHLDFYASEYFSFFEVDIQPVFGLNTTNTSRHLLSGITGLKYLKLELRFSSATCSLSNPWYEAFVQNMYLYSSADPNISSMNFQACPDAFMDWIMTLALPYIKHIPNVKIDGNISQKTKAKWRKNFEYEYRERTFDYSTLSYDHGLALRALLGRPFHA